jgi:hypothetical protein
MAIMMPALGRVNEKSYGKYDDMRNDIVLKLFSSANVNNIFIFRALLIFSCVE